jgi:hypothetical protein
LSIQIGALEEDAEAFDGESWRDEAPRIKVGAEAVRSAPDDMKKEESDGHGDFGTLTLVTNSPLVKKECGLPHRPRLHLPQPFTAGAEPKKKREGSAKPYLVVQFHPAPPVLMTTGY